VCSNPIGTSRLFRANISSEKCKTGTYHDALFWSLRQFYEDSKESGDELSEHEVQLLAELGVVRDSPELPPGPFLADKRLDKVVTYHYPEQTPFVEIFEDISKQSGVRIKLHPTLQDATMSSVRVTEPLRTFMRQRATGPKLHWIRQGRGYLMKPTKKEKKEKKE